MQAIRMVVGVDTAKRVFQLHWVELETGEMVDLRLSRAKLLEHFANRAAGVVGMEACSGALPSWGWGNTRYSSMIQRTRFVYACCQNGSFPLPNS